MLRTLLFLSLAGMLCGADEKIAEPLQDINVPFRLFHTANMHTFLRLDTRTGEVWQLQWSTTDDDHRFIEPIVRFPLTQQGKVGRFTLYPTDNLYNFVLLDQEDGRAWQVQWSLDAEKRLVFPISTPDTQPRDENKPKRSEEAGAGEARQSPPSAREHAPTCERCEKLERELDVPPK